MALLSLVNPYITLVSGIVSVVSEFRNFIFKVPDILIWSDDDIVSVQREPYAWQYVHH